MDPLQDGDPGQIGDYRLLGRLGAGGMGQVYLGATPGGRLVAVKVIRPGVTEDPEFRRRFAREVRAAQSVGGFHTAHVLAADPDASPPWMATAYIAGPSLQALVRDNGPVAVPAAAALGAALAEGLIAIHACGLVHRDLKPGNILMAADGPRIIDFGIARPAGASTLTSGDMLVGTYAYMSPEQFRGDPLLTPASDVFALGCVLTFAVTGHAPFEAPAAHEAMFQVLEAEPALGELGEGPFRGVVEGCLAKAAERRPALPDVLGLLGALAPVPDARAAMVPAPAATALAPAPAPAQYLAESHKNVTITQQANASPGGIVIQVAGNAKIGDDGTF
jgi:serine/threonine protein kinase